MIELTPVLTISIASGGFVVVALQDLDKEDEEGNSLYDEVPHVFASLPALVKFIERRLTDLETPVTKESPSTDVERAMNKKKG